MKLTITQEDVEKGIQSNCKFCPTALAMKRELKIEFASVGVTGGYTVQRNKDLSEDNLMTSYSFSQELTDQICKFDETGVFIPGIYNIKKVSR